LKLCLLLGLGALVACSKPAPLSALEPGEQGRVVRILDGDTVALSTGLVVKLANVEAPAFGRGEAEDALFAQDAARMLEDMALGREVQLYYPGLTRDKYDRAIAHVLTTDKKGGALWLNHEMLRRGGARVRVYADSAQLGALALDAEASARLERAGLWARRAYRIPEAADVPAETEQFLILTGRVRDVSGPQRSYAVCSVALDETAIILDIEPAADAHCALKPGAAIRARGYLKDGHMGISHTLNLTILPAGDQ